MDRPSLRHPARLLAAWIALAAAAGVAALGGCAAGRAEAEPAGGDSRPVVLTTFTVLADIARNVAGDRLRVESITKPGAEIHHYEPTPGDLRRAKEARLILDNGLNLEAWFAKFTDQSGAPHVVVSRGVKPIAITEDAYKGLPNPHAWMSPLNVRSYAATMAGAFATIDPQGAAQYRANAERYGRELKAVHESLVQRINEVPPSQRALVTCEGAFSYLARDAGLKEQFIWAVNAEQQATASQVAEVIEYVKANKVPAVFCESTVSDKAMRQVASATGAAFGGVLYVDSLSGPGGPVPSYLDLIRHDAETIANALSAGGT